MKLLLLLALLSTPWYQTYFDKLPEQTVEAIQHYGKMFDITRHPIIQYNLLIEELEWQRLMLSDSQQMLIGTIALQLAYDRGEKVLKKLPKEALLHKDRIVFFRVLALGLITENVEKLGKKKWHEYMLKFYLPKPPKQ